MARLTRQVALATVGVLIATASMFGSAAPAGATAAEGPVVLNPVSTGTGTAPVAVAVTPNGARAYIANSGNRTIGILNTATNTVTTPITLPTGAVPSSLAITPDGTRVYVTESGNSAVNVIATATNTVTGSPINVGTSPQGIAITPNGQYAYVTNATSNSVSVINTGTNAVIATITGLAAPQGIAITPSGAYAYVTNATSNAVSVIDTATNTVTGSPINVGTSPQGIAITPDGSRAYVANSGTNTVSVINTGTYEVIATLTATLPDTVLNAPRAVAVSPNGTYLYVTHDSTAVSTFATATNTHVADADDLPSGNLMGLTVSPDGGRIYGAGSTSNSLAMMSTGERVSCSYPYSWPSGGGTTANPYRVASQSDLDAVRNCPNSAFLQTQDITLTGSWTPIGTTVVSFTGDYDGDGHAISGLLIGEASVPVGESAGLFGLAQGAAVHDLRIANGEAVMTRGDVGLLVGLCEQCQVTSVEVTGSVTSTGSNTGGLAGQISGPSSTVSQSSSSAVVNGLDRTGGLIGVVKAATISDTCATGSVTGTTRVGGLAGDATQMALLTQTCATGTVTGTQYVGGLVGTLASSDACCGPTPGLYAYINRSFASGNVAATHGTSAYAGGLVGASFAHFGVSGFNITDTFASGSVTGAGFVGGLVGLSYINDPSTSSSYAVGAVNGGASSSTGGFVGGVATATEGNFASDYWNVGMTGRPFGVGGLGSTTTGLNFATIIGLSTEQMRSSQNFSGWDFTTVWGYDCQQSLFPLLRWKVPTATARTSYCPSPSPQNPSSPTATPTSSPTPDASTSPASTTVPNPPALKPGRARATIGGVEVPVRATTLSRGNGVVVTFGGMRFTLRSTTPSGQRVPTAPNGALVIARSGALPITGNGVAPGSQVDTTLYSNPTSLGPTTATTSGTFSSRPTIPSTIRQVTHTLSFTGLTSSSAPFTLDLGVAVASPVAALGAHPVIMVDPRPAWRGAHLAIRAVGVQARCMVDFSLGASAGQTRASESGKAQATLVVPASGSVLKTRVHGKGCTTVRLEQQVTRR